MANKRGISSVVTTVLIVLLTIVAIAILWSFLSPLFKGTGEKIQQQEECVSTNVEIIKCIKNSTNTVVSVTLNSGKNVKTIKIIPYLANGETGDIIEKTGTNVPAEQGTQVYTLSKAYAEVAVSAGIGEIGSDGKIKYCGATKEVKCTTTSGAIVGGIKPGCSPSDIQANCGGDCTTKCAIGSSCTTSFDCDISSGLMCNLTTLKCGAKYCTKTGGINFNVKGTINGLDSSNKPYLNVNDSCDIDGSLIEYSCYGTNVMIAVIYCADSTPPTPYCNDGACASTITIS